MAVADVAHARQGAGRRGIHAVHRDEMARAAAALRIEQLEESIGEQFGIGLDDLVAKLRTTPGVHAVHVSDEPAAAAAQPESQLG